MINKMKRQPIENVKVFANHICNKGLISIMCKELLEQQQKNNNNNNWKGSEQYRGSSKN